MRGSKEAKEEKEKRALGTHAVSLATVASPCVSHSKVRFIRDLPSALAMHSNMVSRNRLRVRVATCGMQFLPGFVSRAYI